MTQPIGPNEISIGHVAFRRVISDGDHGNVQAERVIPVTVLATHTTPDPAAIARAEQVAWDQAMEQVAEAINEAFELQDYPAPLYDGPRYHVARWIPDPELLIIIPSGSRHDVPGGATGSILNHGHRLPKARRIADDRVGQRAILYVWDLSDGDFNDLDLEHKKILAKQAEAHEEENRAGEISFAEAVTAESFRDHTREIAAAAESFRDHTREIAAAAQSLARDLAIETIDPDPPEEAT